jgi:hypothetical protein
MAIPSSTSTSDPRANIAKTFTTLGLGGVPCLAQDIHHEAGQQGRGCAFVGRVSRAFAYIHHAEVHRREC